jgi:TonB-dependent receptor
MNISTALKCLIVFLVVFSINGFSQGIIKGVIKDGITGDKLVGTNVHLAGTSLGASTNIEGEYKIVLIPAGKYKVKISYIGYKSQEKEIVVGNGQTITYDAELKMDVIEGSEIVVTGQAMGQASAINQQKNSNTIVNVLSEEKIQSLPDANAAEAIGRLPGVSIQRSGGEANKIVLRGMSDKFSFVTIDGIRMAPTDADSRGIDLSTISQGSLAGIELYKALTPDKDADAIAGAVNLVTKKAPDERLLRVDVKGTYNKLKNSKDQYDLQLRYGERFFNNVLGVQVTGNLEKKDRSSEQYKVTYSTDRDSSGNHEPNHEITNFVLKYIDETRERQGLSLLLDINTPDEGCIKLNNVFNGTSRNIITYERDYPSVGTIISNVSGVPYSIRYQEQKINTFNSSIHGENNILNLNVLWGGSFSQSMTTNPYDFEMDFVEPTTTQNGVIVSGAKDIPKSILYGTDFSKLIPYFLNNFQAASTAMSYYRDERNLDKEKSAFLDVIGKYVFGDALNGEIKAGGKYRYKNRTKVTSEYDGSDYNQYFTNYFDYSHVSSDGNTELVNVPSFSGERFANLWLNSAGVPLVTNFLESPYQGRNIYDQYYLYPMMDVNAIKLWYDLMKNNSYTNPKKAYYLRNTLGMDDAYDIIERLTSGYIMNTLHYQQWLTFIAGVRVEQEDNDYKSIYLGLVTSNFSTTVHDSTIYANHKETIVCPNFHLTIRPNDNVNVRFAAYKALARPDYNQRLNRYRYNATKLTLVAGNPNLKTAQAWNFEANASIFGNDFGLITISAFYKNIENMYHTITEATMPSGEMLKTLGTDWTLPANHGSDQYVLTMAYNSHKPTKVWGFEFEHQARFEFLPGLLKNIVLSYNGSLVKSETYVYGTIDSFKWDTSYVHGKPILHKNIYNEFVEHKNKMEGQPELYGNVSIGYDIAGFSARISYFYQGRYTTLVSLDGFGDEIQGAYSRLDFSLKYEYDKHLSFFLNVNNLTDTEEKTYLKNNVDNWEIVTSSQKYGLMGDIGVRYTL